MKIGRWRSPAGKKRRIPVGKAVYPVLRRGDYVYVDKTGFIPLLETFFPTNEGTL
mgnify:CR=1 FL=1